MDNDLVPTDVEADIDVTLTVSAGIVIGPLADTLIPCE